MAKISELPEKKVTTEYIVIDGKKYHLDEVKFNISKKFFGADPWMDLMQDFYEQIYSNPAITVSEFIDKMKEKFNLEYKNK
jgi:hypothetical protein